LKFLFKRQLATKPAIMPTGGKQREFLFKRLPISPTHVARRAEEETPHRFCAMEGKMMLTLLA